MADTRQDDAAWPRYCEKHNYLLDKDGRCSLCSLTNRDASKVKKAGEPPDPPKRRGGRRA